MRLFAFVFLFVGLSAFATPSELTIQEVLTRAGEVSPEVASARLKDLAAEQRVGEAEAGYYPSVDLEAVDTAGFPGSTGNLGTSGLLSSPFRKGAAAGVVATIPIWDFGRTSNAVESAQREVSAAKEDTNYVRYRAYQTALQLFYECATYHDLKETWKGLADGAKLVKNVVGDFVRTGQRSIVESYLVDSQVEHALTQESVFAEREKVQAREIALVTGMAPETVRCPTLPSEESAIALFKGAPRGNPLIARAKEAALLAKSKVDQAKADYMPRLIGVANAAVMQDHRLVDSNFYSVGIALIFPVFEGFRTNHKVDEAQALETSAEKEIEARKLEIDQLNLRYDKIIDANRMAMAHLKDESVLAEKGYKTAKSRYNSLQGTATDVRDAFSNLSRTQTQLIDAEAAYLQAMGAKAILNGTPF